MNLSKLDLFYRRLILTKFYTRGWGKPEELQEILKVHGVISNRDSCLDYVNDHISESNVTLENPVSSNGCVTVDGSFVSPVCKLLPKQLPEECKTSHFQMVLPATLRKSKPDSITSLKRRIKQLDLNPLCIHMAGTGDHGFSRRRELIAKPLLSHGISSLLLENPYYGLRKPKDQSRSGLLHVKDLFLMGLCLILETQVLLKWLEKEGFGPFGLTGISMGGHMASLAATTSPKPVAVVPCMSWTSSSVVWTEGVLSNAIPWRVLESQYAKDPNYETQINDLIKYNTVDSYELGKDYVKDKGALKPTYVMKNVAGDQVSEKDDRERRRKQTLRFMKGVMDQVTDLQNFSVPIDPSMATFVIAKADAYYPIHSLRPMNEVWPGCEVRLLNTGHIGGFLMHQTDFCNAIVDTFSKLIEKYHSSKESNSCGNETVNLNESEESETTSSPITIRESDNNSSISKSKTTLLMALFQTLRIFAIKS
uniref:protein ABHD18-like n=1 Tax=Styela clava TaxID=7725 RepID=UPI00193A27AF|nr:protein ABHD18-like [Styela clava]